MPWYIFLALVIFVIVFTFALAAVIDNHIHKRR